MQFHGLFLTAPFKQKVDFVKFVTLTTAFISQMDHKRFQKIIS